MLAGVAGNNLRSSPYPIPPFKQGCRFGLEFINGVFGPEFAWSGGAGGGILKSKSTGEGVSPTTIMAMFVPEPIAVIEGVFVRLELPPRPPIPWGGRTSGVVPEFELEFAFALVWFRVTLFILPLWARIKGVLLTDFETRCILLWEALENVGGDEDDWFEGDIGEVIGEWDGGGRSVSCWCECCEG